MNASSPAQPPLQPDAASGGPSVLGAQFKSGMVWSIVSFFFMGIGGLLFNLIIAHFYSPDVLGIFNQTFALYIFGSQLSAFGIHYSVLRYGALLSDHQPQEAACSVATALTMVTVLSALLCLGCWGGQGWIGRVLNSPATQTSLRWVLPGLFFFPMNKVLMNYLNSRRRMRALAAANSLRYILICGVVLLMACLHKPGETLSLSFSIAETVIFVWTLGLQWPQLKHDIQAGRHAYWLRKHLSFGGKSFFAGLLTELNTRVDILLLGVFLSDSQVGIYSFVAMLAEGFFQLMVIFRVNYDPVITRLIANHGWDDLKTAIRLGRKKTYLVMISLGLLGMALYPFIAAQIGYGRHYGRAWPIFAILLGGMMLSAGFIPFSGLLQQGGYPGTQSLLIFLVTLINIAGNLLLIPLWGSTGSAVGTAFSYVSLAVLLVLLSRWRFGRWL